MIKSRPEIETHVWPFWEISSIVLELSSSALNLEVGGEDPVKVSCDLSLVEAKKLCEELQNSIRKYEEIEYSVQEYFDENREKELKESEGE